MDFTVLVDFCCVGKFEAGILKTGWLLFSGNLFNTALLNSIFLDWKIVTEKLFGRVDLESLEPCTVWALNNDYVPI